MIVAILLLSETHELRCLTIIFLRSMIKKIYILIFSHQLAFIYTVFFKFLITSLFLLKLKKLLVTGNRAQISRKCNLAINAVLKYTAWFVDKYFFNACNYWISRINVVMSL